MLYYRNKSGGTDGSVYSFIYELMCTGTEIHEDLAFSGHTEVCVDADSEPDVVGRDS